MKKEIAGIIITAVCIGVVNAAVILLCKYSSTESLSVIDMETIEQLEENKQNLEEYEQKIVNIENKLQQIS